MVGLVLLFILITFSCFFKMEDFDCTRFSFLFLITLLFYLHEFSFGFSLGSAKTEATRLQHKNQSWSLLFEVFIPKNSP